MCVGFLSFASRRARMEWLNSSAARVLPLCPHGGVGIGVGGLAIYIPLADPADSFVLVLPAWETTVWRSLNCCFPWSAYGTFAAW